LPDILGTVAPGFENLRSAFAEGQAADPGMAQLVVYRGGERVVDLWTQRPAGEGPLYDGDTPTIIMSCTKAVTATCVLRLVERGLIDVDAPVARYWPQFAAAGKADITVAQVMSHASGLSAFDPDAGVDLEAILDWDRSCAALAAMAPLWPPGEACSYHAITLGFILGEIARRVDGRTIGAMVAQDIAGPLGIDLWLGLPDAQQSRVAEHTRIAPALTKEQLDGLLSAMGADPSDRVIRATVDGAVVTEALIDAMNQPALRTIEVPAGNAIATARALAKFYAAVIGEIDGVRLLSKAVLDRARTPLTDDLGGPGALRAMIPEGGMRYGLGYSLPNRITTMLGSGSFGHAGAGGRLAFALPEKQIAVAYVCTSLMPDGGNTDARWLPWTRALEQAVL
jgi:CubicO group peptidase (beta-lactamase class C family)